jgi:hypothetical protein
MLVLLSQDADLPLELLVHQPSLPVLPRVGRYLVDLLQLYHHVTRH